MQPPGFSLMAYLMMSGVGEGVRLKRRCIPLMVDTLKRKRIIAYVCIKIKKMHRPPIYNGREEVFCWRTGNFVLNYMGFV
jgi:hypothetical protein